MRHARVRTAPMPGTGPVAGTVDVAAQERTAALDTRRRKRVARIESRAVAPNSPFIAQCPREGLTQGDPAILDGVMGVDLKVSLATKLQVHHGVLGEEAEHVVEERNAGPNERFSSPVNAQLDPNTGFIRNALHLSVALLHTAPLNNSPGGKTKPKYTCAYEIAGGAGPGQAPLTY